MTDAKVLIVTPMHNERSNIGDLALSLSKLSFRAFDWVVVDDGSTDDSVMRLNEKGAIQRFRLEVRRNHGMLIGGSAFSAWRHGVDAAGDLAKYTHIMKLDADVRLPTDYFELVLDRFTDDVGVAGGVIENPKMREQRLHVPGPVKLYSVRAYRILEELPSAVGFDVMDEVAIQQRGLSVAVVESARFELARAIGASQGGLHGRYRNGRVCRWTGYDPLYFALHLLRYLARRPYILGSFAMLRGFVTAGTGPYAHHLKKAHRSIQRGKLTRAVRSPVSWVRNTYGIGLKEEAPDAI
ncbi:MULTISPECIES: glycosyltransferase family 2 protein [unclassified Rhodococcus (in: high G+C Gram-positive bacteria)]|uniref:glycosyltransferase family 2 protein n=1 Tax=unclassified Rhodococcus (in: high G+C Gram-positive bacteria) TaxID=192944 RepID=UPI00163AFFF2|nr:MULTISPECIES: glycosyltransferase family 2 protein [unclassified Rhodococcus (in: high G+C Gram-positive bacteria)]MBC2642714.1 glycosyltransferase family 2 protein [Rhodococcus sp. 3A]MBC2892544.1 glycosyltransferase family 2 protein [Rhodococcus sp. 4CII]